MNQGNVSQRLRRGWGVVKNSLNVIRGNKKILIIPLLGFIINTLVLIGLFAFGFRTEVSGTWDSFSISPKYDAAAFLSVLVAYALINIVNTFLVGVISHNVLARFDGRATALKTSFSAAWKKRKDLLLFGLAASVAGYLIAIIAERVPFADKLIGWMGYVSWSAASFFAIPIIMLHENEKINPKRAIKESSSNLKKLWSEGVVSHLSLGFILLLAMVVTYVGLVSIMRIIYLIFGNGDGVNPAVGMISILTLVAVMLIVVMSFSLVSLVTRCALLYFGQTRKNPERYDMAIFKADITINKAKKLFL